MIMIILYDFQIRKMLRYLLGNVTDMSQPELLKFECLWPQDKYILYQLYQYASKVKSLSRSILPYCLSQSDCLF